MNSQYMLDISIKYLRKLVHVYYYIDILNDIFSEKKEDPPPPVSVWGQQLDALNSSSRHEWRTDAVRAWATGKYLKQHQNGLRDGSY